jgi:DNA-binding NarL/FixJ family response regulator
VNLVIIEDDANFAHLVAQALDGLVDKVTVMDHWEDLPAIDANDLAWVDLRTPRSGVDDSIRHIHSLRQRRPDIVIVVGSGFITPEVRARLEQAGADGCFYKSSSFTAEQVASLIVLALSRATKRNYEANRKLLARALEWHSHRFPETLTPQ